jgi:hypothetical protein
VWHFSLLLMIDIVQVDYDRRKLIAPNHTCTHMLNFALRVCSMGPLSMNLCIVNVLRVKTVFFFLNVV